ncbi:MAG: Rieske 2Fe-2S domain-containing protein [Novosphingobium sp.]
MADMSVPQKPRWREIQAAPLPDRYARGWHCLGVADSFRDGKPHGVHAFGRKLVVFAGESGELAVLNAHCLHLGGDLSDGRIVGDTVACPFHDWRWAKDGTCAAVPYGRHIPVDRTRAWTTREVNGHLVIWHDHEGREPSPQVDLPVLEAWDSPDWSDWLWVEDVIETHPRELIDNLADPAHFFYVHGQRQGGAADYFSNVFENHVATQYMEQGGTTAPAYAPNEPYLGRPEDINGDLRSESTWHGPAYSVDHLYWKLDGKVVQSVLFLAILPIDLHRFRISLGVLTRNDPDLDEAANDKRHRENFELLRFSTFQDVHIWKNKARIDNPMLSETDGPIYRLRKWYDQFYMDADDVPSQARAYYHKEVDLSHANAVWDAELAGQPLL